MFLTHSLSLERLVSGAGWCWVVMELLSPMGALLVPRSASELTDVGPPQRVPRGGAP